MNTEKLLEALRALPETGDYYTEAFRMLREHCDLSEEGRASGVAFVRFLMVNSPAVRGGSSAGDGRYDYLTQRYTEDSLDDIRDWIDELLSLDPPLLLRARLLDVVVYLDRDASDRWKKVQAAVPALLETVELAAGQGPFVSYFEDHLLRSMKLALRFGGDLVEEVWDTLGKIVRIFEDIERTDRYVKDVAKALMEFGERTGDRERAAELLDGLLPRLRHTAQVAVDDDSTALSDHAFDVLVASREYLADDEGALSAGLEKVDSIVARADECERSFGRLVQLTMALDSTKTLKQKFPKSKRADELHREIKQEIRSAGRNWDVEAAKSVVETRIPARWVDIRYEMVAEADDPVERVYITATLAWFPELDDAWNAQEHAQPMSMAEQIVGQTVRISANGLPVAELETEREKAEGRFDHDTQQLVANFANLTTDHILRRLFENGLVSVQDIVEAFRRVDMVSAERTEVFQRGLTAFFEEDFFTALHLLVPQFESSLRRLYSAATMNDLRENQGRFTSASLSEILTDEEFQIHPGLKRLWAVIFSGGGGLGLKKDVETGLNLRNKVAHGLISDAGCNYSNTFLVVHCLLQLLLVDPDSSWQPCDSN